jgi:formamidopyrimidine-DNA glycosylase
MAQENRLVCDVLLDQLILPGVGNIIKNEVISWISEICTWRQGSLKIQLMQKRLMYLMSLQTPSLFTIFSSMYSSAISRDFSKLKFKCLGVSVEKTACTYLL